MKMTAEGSMRLAGVLLREERNRLLKQAESIERTGDTSPLAKEIGERFRASARRLMPERAIATEALRLFAKRLRSARAYMPGARLYQPGLPGTDLLLAEEAAEAWEKRKMVERTMRAFGWLQ